MYRHALPAGFVLKKDKKKDEKEDEISMEELIENEVDVTIFSQIQLPTSDIIIWPILHLKPQCLFQSAASLLYPL